jgi:hypothetical protein
MLSFDLLKVSQNLLVIEFNEKIIIIKKYRIKLEGFLILFPILSNFVSNHKKSRKKKRNFNNWKINVRKVNYQRGIEHISSKGELIKARKMRDTCDQTCIHKCNSRITLKEREKIFNSFYSIDNTGKREFINRLVEKSINSKNSGINAKKHYNYIYCFLLGNQKVRVCKKYFLSTLDISQTFVYMSLKNRESITGVVLLSKQGKHQKKVISEERKNLVIAHIYSFPTVDSHYRRTQSTNLI